MFTASCRFGLHDNIEAIPLPLIVLYALHHPLPLLLSLLPLAVLFSNILDNEFELEVLKSIQLRLLALNVET
jgi:hypothetical protein